MQFTQSFHRANCITVSSRIDSTLLIFNLLELLDRTILFTWPRDTHPALLQSRRFLPDGSAPASWQAVHRTSHRHRKDTPTVCRVLAGTQSCSNRNHAGQKHSKP